MAAKPTLNCCRVVSLPCNSCVYLLGAFLRGTAFLGQKASHFVPFGGMANGQRLENALQLLALAFGKVCRIQACLEAAGSNAEQVWVFFFYRVEAWGAGCDSCLVDQPSPTQPLLLGSPSHLQLQNPERPGSPAVWYSQPSRKLCKAHKSNAGE